MKELIERMQAHFYEDAGCWIWKGAMQAQTKSAVPFMQWRGKVGAVRRHVAVEMGLKLGGKVATHSCGNPLCVNPDHIRVVTRSQFQRELAKRTTHQASPARLAKIAEAKRSKAKLNEQAVAEIRQANEPQQVLAQRYGVSQATISEIKRGLIWRDFSNPFDQLARSLRR